MLNGAPSSTGNTAKKQFNVKRNNSHPSDPNHEMLRWLQSYGIQFNPFNENIFDAGSDPQLSTYLVGHEDFEALHRDQATLVYAPVGGGKTAFRVRLVRACRVWERGRALFPITYKMPSPKRLGKSSQSFMGHLKYINEAVAKELLLTIIYRPEIFFKLAEIDRQKLCEFLHQVLQNRLRNYLQQLESQHTLQPLMNTFDPTVAYLFSLPDWPTLQNVCQTLADARDMSLSTTLKPLAHFNQIVELLQGPLGYEGIYLLVDGIDAHVETVNQPCRAMAHLKPLLRETAGWAQQGVYAKYFLPTELLPKMKFEDLHHSNRIVDVRSVQVEWTPKLLKEMIQARMLAASEGRYDSLAVISTSALQDIDNRLIEMARSYLPREVLALINRTLWEHVTRRSEPDVIEEEDLQRVQQWYKEEN